MRAGLARQACWRHAYSYRVGRRTRCILCARCVLSSRWPPLGGCGTLPPNDPARRASTACRRTRQPLAKIAPASTPSPDSPGVRLMPLGVFSLDARIQLAQRAQRSLDVQYYQLENDATGRLLLRRCATPRSAASGCACWSTTSTPTGADALLLALAALPNVEVRLFNPFCCARATASRRASRRRCSTSDGSTTACTTSCSSPTA